MLNKTKWTKEGISAFVQFEVSFIFLFMTFGKARTVQAFLHLRLYKRKIFLYKDLREIQIQATLLKLNIKEFASFNVSANL